MNSTTSPRVSRTFRRDRLRRLVEAGKVKMVEGYSFDDMLGEHRTNKVMDVKMMPDNRLECKEGTCYVFPSDFNSGSGACYTAGVSKDGEQLVTLYVHSNCNYTFLITK